MRSPSHLGGQTGPALPTPRLDDRPPGPYAHPHPEPVLASTPTIVRLKRALHANCPPELQGTPSRRSRAGDATTGARAVEDVVAECKDATTGWSNRFPRFDVSPRVSTTRRCFPMTAMRWVCGRRGKRAVRGHRYISGSTSRSTSDYGPGAALPSRTVSSRSVGGLRDMRSRRVRTVRSTRRRFIPAVMRVEPAVSSSIPVGSDATPMARKTHATYQTVASQVFPAVTT